MSESIPSPITDETPAERVETERLDALIGEQMRLNDATPSFDDVKSMKGAVVREDENGVPVATVPKEGLRELWEATDRRRQMEVEIGRRDAASRDDDSVRMRNRHGREVRVPRMFEDVVGSRGGKRVASYSYTHTYRDGKWWKRIRGEWVSDEPDV